MVSNLSDRQTDIRILAVSRASRFHALRERRGVVGRILCFAALSFLFVYALSADMGARERSHRTVVRFSVGQAAIDTAAFGNGRALDSLRTVSASIMADSTVDIAGIRFDGYASPEGPASLNRRLSQQRRLALEEYVRKHTSLPDSLYSSSNAVYDTVSACAYVNASVAERAIMAKDFAPLRYASVEISYQQRGIRPSAVPMNVSVAESALAYAPDSITPVNNLPPDYQETKTGDSASSCRPFYLGVRTNMLYDALLVPTLGAEVYVGRNLSISGQWSYAWWSKNRSHRYWRFYGGDLGMRWWFGRHAHAKPLTGHHLGVYAQLFTYDFETGGRGQMGAKFNYGGGIEYGFALPVASRFNIDFSVGIGYLAGRYHDYKPIDGHYVWQATRNRHWFGPTKAEVSLVWLIGRGNRNEKGGAE